MVSEVGIYPVAMRSLGGTERRPGENLNNEGVALITYETVLADETYGPLQSAKRGHFHWWPE
jgi:hypothetical protein